MENTEYLENNIVEVKDIINELETRMKVGEQGLDTTIHTFRRHLKDLEKQRAEAEKELVVVG